MSHGGLIIATPQELAAIIKASVKEALADLTPQQPILPEFQLSDVLTRQQVKDYLGVSLSTLNLWSKDTDERPALLVPFKIGHQVRYRRENVLAAFKETRRYKKQGE